MSKEPSLFFSGLVLLSTTDGYLPDATKDAMRKAIDVMNSGGFEQYVDDSIPLYLTEEGAKDPVLVNQIKNMMYDVGADLAMRQYGAIINMDKAFDHLFEISCPALVVRGGEDQRTSLENAKSLSDDIPNTHLEIIKGSAHFVPFAKPDVFGRLLGSWLGSLS